MAVNIPAGQQIRPAVRRNLMNEFNAADEAQKSQAKKTDQAIKENMKRISQTLSNLRLEN